LPESHMSNPLEHILICGDTHGRFDHLAWAVEAWQPRALIFTGDLAPTEPLELELAKLLPDTEVWFIHGNHDTDSDAGFDRLFNSALGDRNLHGRVVEIAGVRIAGLGGVFRQQIWMPPAEPAFRTPEEYLRRTGEGCRWRNGLPRRHYSSIFACDVGTLAQLRADILITHEAPSCHKHGFHVIDDLARAMQVKSIFHGHHHETHDYTLEGRLEAGHFDAYGIALHGIRRADGMLIV
jgi:predicted phosphodiesterase